MKLCTSTVLLVGSLLTLKGQALPKDLMDLKGKWVAITKNIDHLEVIAEPSLENFSDGLSFAKASEIIKEATSDLKVNDLTIKSLDKNARTTLTKRLFASLKNGEQPSFCKAFPSQKVNSEELSPEEIEAKQAKEDNKSCRRAISEMLKGSFYLEPELWYSEARDQDGKGKLIIYIRSLFEEDNYLKYQFTL